MSQEDRCITSKEHTGQRSVEECKDVMIYQPNDSNEHNSYSLKGISILDINSADDVSTEKTDDDDDQSNEDLNPIDLVSWQCLSDLPSIQTMTNFLINTCNNYRETMKAVLSGKPEDLSKGDSERTTDTSDVNDAKEKVTKKGNTTKILEMVPLIKDRDNEDSGPSALGTQSAPPSRKRGRPPKAESTKRIKKRRAILREFYNGKLRDLVIVTRSDSESDVDITCW